jgi:GNAT superfamily N-acetyltransferase
MDQLTLGTYTGYRKPTHEPNYINAGHCDLRYAAAVRALKPRWRAADYSTGWATAHQRLRITEGVADFSEFWQIVCLVVDPAYDGQGIKEELVEWGLRIADAMALWVIAVHPEAEKGFYQRLGFECRDTYMPHVEGDDEKISLARLRRIPRLT